MALRIRYPRGDTITRSFRPRIHSAALVCGALSVMPVAGAAQSDTLPRFRFLTMVVFAGLESTVRYDFGTGLIGVRVGFETNLGLDQFQTFPMVYASYRVGGRHHILGSYYSLGRSAVKRVERDIPLPDTTITIGTTVDSRFRTQVLTLGYGYSVLQTATGAIMPYVALYLADWEASIDIQGVLVDPRHGEVNTKTPLPMIGVEVYAAVASRLFIQGNLGLFFLTVGDYSGSIIEINALLSYRLFPFLTLSGGYSIFAVGVQATAPDFRGEVRYRFDGPSLAATLSF